MIKLNGFIVILTCLFVVGNCEDLCSFSFCQCEEDSVDCDGGDSEDLLLSATSLPSSVYSLTVSNFNNVLIKINTFAKQDILSILKLKNVNKLKLGKFIFSTEEYDGFLEVFEIENIQDLELEESSFDNAPQCNQAKLQSVTIKAVPSGGIKLHADTMKIENCKIGELNKESIYSDSMNFIFLSNTVGYVKTHGFSGSNSLFNFSNNYIEKMESNAISVAFLTGDISGNTFLSHSGTPLRDVGPEPVCMPQYSSYDEDAVVEYKKVATPSFRFTQNKFPKFDLSILNMPGTKNVPLGDFTIENNRVPCDCSLIKDLAVVSDFEDVDVDSEERVDIYWGDAMFKKLFYSTSVCYDSEGLEWKLKRFARDHLDIIEIAQTGKSIVSCTNST